MKFIKRGRGKTDFFCTDQSVKCLKTYTLYYKWCIVIWNTKNKGIFANFFTTENRNLNSEIAKVENLKNTKVSSNPTAVGAMFRQSVSENFSHIFSKTKHHYPGTKKALQTGWTHFTISHQSAIFSGYSPCVRGDTKFSIFHVTPRDHVIRESSEIMGEFPSSWLTTLPSVVVIGLAEEKTFFLVCHVAP